MEISLHSPGHIAALVAIVLVPVGGLTWLGVVALDAFTPALQQSSTERRVVVVCLLAVASFFLLWGGALIGALWYGMADLSRGNAARDGVFLALLGVVAVGTAICYLFGRRHSWRRLALAVAAGLAGVGARRMLPTGVPGASGEFDSALFFAAAIGLVLTFLTSVFDRDAPPL